MYVITYIIKKDMLWRGRGPAFMVSLECLGAVLDVAVVHHLGGQSPGPLDHELGPVVELLPGQLEPGDALLLCLHGDGDRVWGSLFGGGSDGHVLGDASVTMRQGMLGTTGTTSWDGNIFGGGRNYSAVSQSAGRVGGNVTVTMTGGHMLGSIFGGGRLGSVGVDEEGTNMQDGAGHGFVTVNVGDDDEQNTIVIGHTATTHDDRVGGNVYGGGKGIAGAPTSIYPNLAKVKQTEVNIRQKTGSETWIEGSVFGGGEDGHVLQDTYVNIYDGQIGGKSFNSLEPCAGVYHGNVYGGGRGVDTYEHEGAQIHSHTAGWVQGNTNVNMVGGHVVRNVYGGGNIASVGIADEPDPEPGQDYRTG